VVSRWFGTRNVLVQGSCGRVDPDDVSTALGLPRNKTLVLT
jgi:hypothetical protein